MAVGLKPPVNLPAISGISLGVGQGGVKQPDHNDLLVILCEPGTRTAAVFTRNQFCAAPVDIAREHLGGASPRALLINSGNANAGTGEPGRQDARELCAALAKSIDCAEDEVLPFSTGVIGQRLPVSSMLRGLSECVRSTGEDRWLSAAQAIMTTDSVPKGASRQFRLDGVDVTITGIVKGAGMIRPDMATMLAFLATDAAVSEDMLQLCLGRAVEQSFHRITVDGDTSTNDACVLMATGQAGNSEIIRTDDAACQSLFEAVSELMRELAQAVIRDAEGATKFVTIEVVHGRTEPDCLQIAYSIANSPLVKTALFASDPNWGRILAAMGRSGVGLDVERVAISINGVAVVVDGQLDGTYTEAQGQRAMAPHDLHILVQLGLGEASSTVWTSDLSYDYVRINAEYRS